MRNSNPLTGAWSVRATPQQLVLIGYWIGRGQRREEAFTVKPQGRPGHYVIEGDAFLEAAFQRAKVEYHSLS